MKSPRFPSLLSSLLLALCVCLAAPSQALASALTARDLQNYAKYDAEGFGIGGGVGFNADFGLGENVTAQGSRKTAETPKTSVPVLENNGYVPNFQLVDVPSLKSSPVIVPNTTVMLSHDVPLVSGQLIPKGSVVTVNGDAMKVVLPDGTSSMARYSTSVQKALPVPTSQVAKGGTSAVNRLSNALPENPSQLSHIFRDAPGHLPDTPANRQLLLDTGTNPSNSLGTNRFGNDVFISTRANGSQVWVETRNGIIQNGGVNNPPRTWIPNEGLR
jgi:hypothetical protein